MRGDKLGEVHFRQGFIRLGERKGSNMPRADDVDRMRRQRSVAGTMAGRVALSRVRMSVVGMAGWLFRGAVAAIGAADGRLSRRSIAAETGNRQGEHQQDHQQGNCMSKRRIHWVPGCFND